MAAMSHDPQQPIGRGELVYQLMRKDNILAMIFLSQNKENPT
jgi:hypothetical protein